MKISPIFSNQLQIVKNQKTEYNSISPKLPYDSFEKTINFKGIASEFSKRADDFSNEMLKLMATGKMQTEEIISAVARHSSDTNFDILSPNSTKGLSMSEMTIGYLKVPMAITTDGRVQLVGKKTILSTPPRRESFEELARTYAQISHEFTHSIQYDYPEKSRVTVASDFLKRNNVNDRKNGASVQFVNDIFKGIEANLQAPLIFSLKSDYRPRELSKTVDETLREILTPKIGNIGKYMEKSTTSAIDNAEKQVGPLNRKFILSFISKLAQNESEAYSQETKFLKKAYGINPDSVVDLDTMPAMYDKWVGVLDKMSKKL